MSSTLQVCLYNAEPESSKDLQGHIAALNFVRLVAEVDTPESLAAALADSGIHLVFFHLDPDPPKVIELIDQVSQRFPELAMIALSHETGPEAILGPIRAGCDQFVCEPIEYADLAAAVGRIASKRLLSRSKSRCICLTGVSGGSGVTSIACNLAMEIAQLTNKKCALVDLDLQFGNIAFNFDCEPQYTLHDAAVAGGDLDRGMLENILTQLSGEVAILARPKLVEQSELVTADRVHHVIELLTTIHENIVVDLPRRISRCNLAALEQADVVLIICQLLVPSIRNASRYVESLTRAGIPEDRIEVIVNRGDSSGGRITIKDLEDLTKKPIFAAIPSDYQFVARSLDFGKPIAGHEQNNAVRTEIRRIAHKLVSGPSPEAAQRDTRRGFLSRLLSK